MLRRHPLAGLKGAQAVFGGPQWDRRALFIHDAVRTTRLGTERLSQERPARERAGLSPLSRFANDLDLDGHDHHNPQQRSSMVLHRALLVESRSGPSRPVFFCRIVRETIG
jgi:hypothetical protein